MRPTRYITLALTLAALSARPGHVSAQTEDPYQGLRQYDYQRRQPVMAIRSAIVAAGHDKAQLATIEIGLVGVLKDPSSTLAGKQEAARLLWPIGTARSVPALAPMLTDPQLTDVARYALERNTDPSAGAALRAALGKATGTVLVGIINSIGNRGDAQAVASLRKLAASGDALVSEAAITALGKVGTPAAVAALQALPGKKESVYTAMLHAAAKQAAGGQRKSAVQMYSRLAGKGYPAVTRIAAIRALADLKDPQAATLALAAAASEDGDLQRAGGHLAGSLITMANTKGAVASWSRLPAAAQVSMLSAWADRHEAAAAGYALAALKSDNPDVQRAAIQALAAVGGPKAVPALVEASTTGDHQQAAREALARMRGAGVEQAILQAAQQGSSSSQQVLMLVLGERATPTATEVMLRAAAGNDAQVASTALRSLGRTGSVSAEPRLVQVLLSAPSEEVRDAAQSAIVAIAQRSGDRNQAVTPLLSALQGAATPAQIALLSALAEVGGDRALEELARATESTNAEVKSAAVTALANTWSEPSALPTLIKIARTGGDRPSRVLALRGYLRIAGTDNRAPSDRRLERVQEAMTVAERPEEKRQALSVLRDIRTSGAVNLAANALDDPDLVAEAANAILYLAAQQRRGNANLPAVRGEAMTRALDKVIRTVKDENVRAQAEKLRQG